MNQILHDLAWQKIQTGVGQGCGWLELPGARVGLPGLPLELVLNGHLASMHAQSNATQLGVDIPTGSFLKSPGWLKEASPSCRRGGWQPAPPIGCHFLLGSLCELFVGELV